MIAAIKRRWKQLLDRGQHRYKSADFEVRIEPMSHECVSVAYTDPGKTLNVEAPYTGRRWGERRGIQIVIPFGFDPPAVAELARRLKEALAAIGYEYCISVALKSGYPYGADQQYRVLEVSEEFGSRPNNC